MSAFGLFIATSMLRFGRGLAVGLAVGRDRSAARRGGLCRRLGDAAVDPRPVPAAGPVDGPDRDPGCRPSGHPARAGRRSRRCSRSSCRTSAALFLLTLFVAQVVLTVASRGVVRGSLHALRDRGHNLRYMLVVGTGKEARRFADRVERHRELGIRVIGHLVHPRRTRCVAGKRPVLGSMDDIETVLHDRDRRRGRRLPARRRPALGRAGRPPVRGGRQDRPHPARRRPRQPARRPRRGLRRRQGAVARLRPGPRPRPGREAAHRRRARRRRARSCSCPSSRSSGWPSSSLDGRPVIFRQTRVGLHGRPFDVVKFRTMVPDAEALLTELEEQNEIKGHAFKITDDPRLTRIGRFLRATSLDELPQVWNVLLGEMSLVGPRPPLPREVDGYDLWHRRRLSMKPGITGLWQVAARRDDDFDRWVALDLALHRPLVDLAGPQDHGQDDPGDAAGPVSARSTPIGGVFARPCRPRCATSATLVRSPACPQHPAGSSWSALATSVWSPRSAWQPRVIGWRSSRPTRTGCRSSREGRSPIHEAGLPEALSAHAGERPADRRRSAQSGCRRGDGLRGHADRPQRAKRSVAAGRGTPRPRPDPAEGGTLGGAQHPAARLDQPRRRMERPSRPAGSSRTPSSSARARHSRTS